MQKKVLRNVTGIILIAALLITAIACSSKTSTTTSSTTTIATTTAATSTTTASTTSTTAATTSTASTTTAATGAADHEGTPYTPYTGKFDRTFTYYAVLPLSGSGAAGGIRVQRIFNWAIDDFNAQGGLMVDGVRYKITVQYLDHAQNVQKANDAVNAVINQYNAKFAYEQTTAEVLATEDAIAKANILDLVEVVPQPGTISPKWPLQFSTVVTPGTYGATVYYPLFTKDFGVHNVVMVDPDSDNGRVFSGITRNTSAQLNEPITFLADLYYTPGTQDFSPLVNKIISLKTDMIDMPAAADADAGLFCKQLRDAGYKGVLAATCFTIDPGPLWSIAGADSTGFFSLGYATPPTQKYSNLIGAYLKAFNEPSITTSVSDYDSITNLFKAINQANTFDAYKVASILQDMTWDGAFGSNTQYAGNEPGSIFGIKRVLKINVPMIQFTTNGDVKAWESGSLP